MEKFIDDAFIKGDLFSGLCVDEYDDATYRFETDGEDVKVYRKLVKDLPDRKVCSFKFSMKNPVRFRMDVYIPDDAINAHIGLNGRELIGFFDKDVIINDPEPLIKGSCNDPHKVSTIKPGEFQALNFKWEDGDELTFCFYFLNK